MITVIVPVYGAAAVVQACLASLHGEINAQLQDGGFRNLLTQYQPTEDTHSYPDSEIIDGVTPLTARNATSDLQHAGLWISQSLGVPSYLDIRRR